MNANWGAAIDEAIAGDKVISQLDWQVPCERMARAKVSYDNGATWVQGDIHCGGQNPAEWILYSACSCAPTVLLYCTACRDEVVSYLRLSCSICREVWIPARLAFRLIEPLNRRTT